MYTEQDILDALVAFKNSNPESFSAASYMKWYEKQNRSKYPHKDTIIRWLGGCWSNIYILLGIEKGSYSNKWVNFCKLVQIHGRVPYKEYRVLSAGNKDLPSIPTLYKYAGTNWGQIQDNALGISNEGIPSYGKNDVAQSLVEFLESGEIFEVNTYSNWAASKGKPSLAEITRYFGPQWSDVASNLAKYLNLNEGN